MPQRRALDRRRFLVSAGLTAAGVALGARGGRAQDGAPVTLRVVERELVVKGRKSRAFRIEQPDGTWGFRGTRGGRFTAVVENRIDQPTSVHWHGLVVPNDQDGVPYVTQLPIPPGGQHRYDFPLVQSGSFWMHSHYRLQAQRFLSAPLLLAEPGPPAEPDVLMFLSDWSFREPRDIWADLRKKVQAGTSMPGMRMPGTSMPGTAVPGSSAPATRMPGMSMPGTPGGPTSGSEAAKAPGPDLADVAYDAFLTNERAPSDPDVIRVQPGQPVRLRIVNGASATNFFVDLGPLRGQAIAVDGEPIVPLPGPRFSLPMANRMDVRVAVPPGEGAYPILAQGEGTAVQTGLVLATPGARPPALGEKASRPAGPMGYGQELRLRAPIPLPPRPVDRTLTLTLGGNMQDYVWTINGQEWPDVTPQVVRHGERVEVVVVNQNGMAHPMHLHGHTFQVTEIAGTRVAGARRDTVLVMPRTTVKLQFDADNPGTWMAHCHVLYHEKGGMMTTIDYEGYRVPHFGRRR